MDKYLLEKIITITCKEFVVNAELLHIKCRKADVKNARWFVWKIIYDNETTTLKKVANIFGNYDHTSIVHALQTLKIQLKNNYQLLEKYKSIIAQLDIKEKRKQQIVLDNFNDVDFISDAQLKKKMRGYKRMIKLKQQTI